MDSLAARPALAFETAAGHLSTRVPVALPSARVDDVLRSLRGRRFDTAARIAICEDGRLFGLLNVEDLLAAPDDAIVGELMDANPSVMAPGADQEVAAWTAVQHGESTLAVVDDTGRFLGLIPSRRLVAVLFREHEEDLARLGGFLKGASSARTASEEPIARRLWHRLPWLFLGLLGALLSVDIVGAFEDQLADRVILAFFVPSVVYLADAVGTQTETLVIRGLSVGIPIGRVVRKELLTGSLVGGGLVLVFFPIAWWRWGETDVILAVSFALLAACSIASVVAMALPCSRAPVLVSVSRTGVPRLTVIVAGSNFSMSVALTSTACGLLAGLLLAGAATIDAPLTKGEGGSDMAQVCCRHASISPGLPDDLRLPGRGRRVAAN